MQFLQFFSVFSEARAALSEPQRAIVATLPFLSRISVIGSSACIGHPFRSLRLLGRAFVARAAFMRGEFWLNR